MWALDKKPTGRQVDDGAASPALIVVAIVLFFILVLAAIDLHREALIAAALAVSRYGIEPTFVGP